MFEDGCQKKAVSAEEDQKILYEKTGRLEMQLDWLKKNTAWTLSEKRALVDSADPSLTVSAQREALGLSKSTVYYEPVRESAENLRITRQLDELYIVCPFYGYRRMTAALNRTGYQVNESLG